MVGLLSCHSVNLILLLGGYLRTTLINDKPIFHFIPTSQYISVLGGWNKMEEWFRSLGCHKSTLFLYIWRME